MSSEARPGLPVNITGGTATPEFVLKTATDIFRKWMDEKVPLEDTKAVDAAYKRYSVEYADFMRAYPLAFRYIINLKWFNARAFDRYLKYVAAQPKWKTHIDFLESQATYDTLLYKATNPKWNAREVKERYDTVRQSLLDDWQAVDDARKKAMAECEENDKALADKIRAALIAQAQASS